MDCTKVWDMYTQELMDPDRWQQLVLQFRQDNFKLHQLSTNSVFYVVLQAGLSALKTPYPLLTYTLHKSHVLSLKIRVFRILLHQFP